MANLPVTMNQHIYVTYKVQSKFQKLFTEKDIQAYNKTGYCILSTAIIFEFMSAFALPNIGSKQFCCNYLQKNDLHEISLAEKPNDHPCYRLPFKENLLKLFQNLSNDSNQANSKDKSAIKTIAYDYFAFFTFKRLTSNAGTIRPTTMSICRGTVDDLYGYRIDSSSQ